ncbi:TraB/GumN family protein [Arenimonas sp. MALMAid1274]|uniref:TraB/GumN family protein n=1 Tax=Arenimonas sp. MALMAid1274 TaxID=3411630 RepID=UPI003BA13426
MSKRWIATLLLATATTFAQAEPPKPLLWKVSDADNSVYLMGSFHLLKPGDYPLAPSTDAAFEDAEKVVFELSPQEMNDPSLGPRMQQAGTRTDGKTLQQTLPEATWKQLEAWATRRGANAAMFQGMEPWLASLVISITEMQLLGLDPKLGLDKHFADRAVAAGKPVEGLETGAQQIEMFDGMDEKEQLQSLQEALAEMATMEAEIGKLHDLWRQGDADALFAGTGAEMKADYPLLYDRLNKDRNLAWMPRLRALLDQSKEDDTLVVVGAMHLLGEDGVIALLKAQGYTVERL